MKQEDIERFLHVEEKDGYGGGLGSGCGAGFGRGVGDGKELTETLDLVSVLSNITEMVMDGVMLMTEPLVLVMALALAVAGSGSGEGRGYRDGWGYGTGDSY